MNDNAKPVPVDKPNPAGSQPAVATKLEDIPILAGRRWYITVSALLAIIGSIVSGTYFVVDYLQIRPLQKELEDSRTTLSNTKTDAQNLKSLLDHSEQRSSALAAAASRPVAVFPADRESVVGSSLSFSWDYAKHTPETKYIIEVSPLADGHRPMRLNVDRPETKSMFYSFAGGQSGEFLWRVRPGELVSGQEVGEGPWSSAAVFTVYPSVVERIRRSGKLLVATTPTTYDPFVGVNTKGQYVGFELKFLRWLLPKLAGELHMDHAPELTISEVPWNELFVHMQNGASDIAVRSITRSEIREKEYPNLRFSVGYARNHQMFVQANRDGQFPASLAGRLIGAKSRSINEAAAKYLAAKYNFTVNSTFTAYGDLYDALRRGDIAFALVDTSLVREHLNRTVFALGSNLDAELKDFYQKQLGLDHEEYAVLVYEGVSSELRDALNRILRSGEFHNFVKSTTEAEPPS